MLIPISLFQFYYKTALPLPRLLFSLLLKTLHKAAEVRKSARKIN